jgi:hypothetical protein
MKFYNSLLAITTLAVVAASGKDRMVDGAGAPPPSMGFFVTSAKSKTGNLGGLAGADRICQNLATAVGQGDKTWRAYLSVERDPANNDKPTNARERIGAGPWFNANGLMIGQDLADLHERRGNPILFVDERGQPVPGAWPGSPRPNEHDILTGSTADGRVVPGKTCSDWTSESADMQAQVGHVTRSGLVAIPHYLPVRGTRRMRVEAAPIPLPVEVRADSTASWRSKDLP